MCFLSQTSLAGLLGYFGARFILGPFRKMPAAGKTLFPIAFFIFYIDTDRRLKKNIPRRLYTEILTTEGADGEYIRTTLSQKTPALWSHLSK